jgi:ABC-type nitrate/sulfonate/bicarbonate transport system substrate-binding protein
MTSGTTYDRRWFLRRGATVAGGLALAGPLGTLLTACGDDDDSSSATTAAGAATTTGGSTATTALKMTKLAYQLSWLPTVEHCGTYIAIEDGMFEGLGLDVSVLPGGPNKQTVATVVGGNALVGGDGADNIGQGRSQGAKVKIIGARLLKNPLCVMSLSSTPIKTPADLAGKRIGVAQGNQTPWEVFLKASKTDASNITIVPVQFDPSPTANGEVDGQVVFSINEPAQLKAKGIDTDILLFADYGFSIFAGAYFATEDTIKNKKDELVAFLKGERMGFEADIADPALGTKYTIDIYGKDIGLDPAQQLLQSQALESLMVTPATEKNGLLFMDPAEITKNIDTLKIAGIDVSSADLFTDEILSAM